MFTFERLVWATVNRRGVALQEIEVTTTSTVEGLRSASVATRLHGIAPAGHN